MVPKLEGTVVGSKRETRAVRRPERHDRRIVGEALDPASLASELGDDLL
jgi:hypothetical protein